MRAIILLLLASLLFLHLAGNAQSTETIAAREARAHASLRSFTPSAQTSTYDMIYQRAEWNINPAVRYISGAITSHFRPGGAALNQLWMNLDNALIVDSVLYHSTKIPFQQTEEDLLRIDLPAAVATNTVDSVTVYYQGTPPNTGYGSFVQRSHSGAPIIWTLSQPYGAKDWWPCKQSLTDKIDSIDIVVRTPAGNRAASNGVLVSETEEGSDKVYHWRHRYPIATYLVAVAVTNYVAFTDLVPYDNSAIEVLNYVYPESEASFRQQSKNVVGMMQLFNRLFGLYPFADEKYGHAQFGWSGGMEHQTMSFMVNLNYDLMAHELAHQWFGNKVTCGSWQDIWVNEGFATYLTGLTKEHLSSPEDWYNWKRSKILSVTAYPGGSVWVRDTTSIDELFSGRLSYNKGAYLLHMLRWVVGDEAFYRGINNYLQDPALAYGFARAEDVKRHLESSSGKNLTEFFNDWYYGEGYPMYRLIWQQNDDHVSLSLSQSSSVPASVSFFEMPVPVLFRDSTGSQEMIKVFQHSEQEQNFEAEIPFKVAEVVLDPELWLLSPTPVVESQAEVMEASLKLYPNPTNTKITLEAGQELTFSEVILLDVQGRQLKLHNAKGRRKLEISTKGLATGTYILRINTNQGIVSKRFTKQ
ncbi:M1 family aminopeptidase [Cesiribacter sp. SM1]|uniref:M1 family aminopeptidase n=1 Tax=Cesiribacter sp. SM1 TaxID=2861196 RepID=UPI001CD798A1|nr:M1 family aminopeptidase [Cesiribacter sp. SM1]